MLKESIKIQHQIHYKMSIHEIKQNKGILIKVLFAFNSQTVFCHVYFKNRLRKPHK